METLRARVEQLENKNQFVIKTNEALFFQSYSSICAICKDGKLTFGVNWDYSNTTRKHLYIFIEGWCYIAIEDREAIYNALSSSNKRKAFQKLIDDGIINYDGALV